jgi:hypothetical protein
LSYAVEHANKAIERKKKAETKVLKEKTTNWKNKLQTKVQEIARLIDKGLPCIARGNSKQLHGGHVLPKKGNECMRFNLHNIHRQGAHSNHFQNDDAVMREGVEKEYGESYLTFIKSLAKKPIPKLHEREYMAKYQIAHEISKALIKKCQTYSLEERIELRNRYNLEIGIYEEKFCVFVSL